MFNTLILETQGPIASVSFNRPESSNSFNAVMAQELKVVTELLRVDNTIRAVMLKGEGQLFMTGGDITFLQQEIDNMPKGVKEIISCLNTAIYNLMFMPKPVLACVHGTVAGVGMSLMLACDLVIASQRTIFSTAYASLGASPDGGITFTLPRQIGTKKAMQLLMLPQVYNAKEAFALGLLNWIVPEDTLTSEANKILTQLVQGPHCAIAEIKKLINQSWQHDLANQLEQESVSFAACSITDDFKEGINAFLQKRKPEFKGL